MYRVQTLQVKEIYRGQMRGMYRGWVLHVRGIYWGHIAVCKMDITLMNINITLFAEQLIRNFEVLVTKVNFIHCT